jgi:hypothetical protein
MRASQLDWHAAFIGTSVVNGVEAEMLTSDPEHKARFFREFSERVQRADEYRISIKKLDLFEEAALKLGISPWDADPFDFDIRLFRLFGYMANQYEYLVVQNNARAPVILEVMRRRLMKLNKDTRCMLLFGPYAFWLLTKTAPSPKPAHRPTTKESPARAAAIEIAVEFMVLAKEGFLSDSLPYSTVPKLFGVDRRTVQRWVAPELNRSGSRYERVLKMYPDPLTCLLNAAAAYRRSP